MFVSEFDSRALVCKNCLFGSFGRVTFSELGKASWAILKKMLPGESAAEAELAKVLDLGLLGKNRNPPPT